MTMSISPVNAKPHSIPVDSTESPAAQNRFRTADSIDSLMPEPRGTDIGLAIAALAIENAFDTRKQAREDRRLANTKMIAAQKEQIADLRKEAKERYEANKSEAWGKIAEGAFGIAGGIAAGAGRPNLGAGLSSTGKVGSGLMSRIAAGERFASDCASADAKADEMEAGAQKHAIENAEDEIKEAREHARTALDFLREFQATEVKTMGSAIRA